MTAPIIDTTPMTRTDWLAWRKHGLGGSDIAALLGLSKWASPWSLWAEKTGAIGEQNENDEMVGGRWLELAITPWFTARTGLHVVYQQARCHRPDRPWQRCTIDGVATDTPHLDDITNALGVVEIKTGERGPDWTDIPAYYQAQAQWQMATLDLHHTWIPMLHGRRLTIYELARDQADIDFMVEEAERFWFDHVVAGTPPPVDGSDATLDALGQMWPHHIDGRTADLDHIADALDDLEQAKADTKAAQTREKHAKARIVEAMGPAEIGLVDGRPALTLREQSRTDIDTKRLRQAMPDVFDELSTSTSFRVLRPKKKAA